MASFFFHHPAPTGIYTLSLHDALPISRALGRELHRLDDLLVARAATQVPADRVADLLLGRGDRKSTRLNSSHRTISYAVFCLKKNRKNSPRKHTRPSPRSQQASDRGCR